MCCMIIEHVMQLMCNGWCCEARRQHSQLVDLQLAHVNHGVDQMEHQFAGCLLDVDLCLYASELVTHTFAHTADQLIHTFDVELCGCDDGVEWCAILMANIAHHDALVLVA